MISIKEYYKKQKIRKLRKKVHGEDNRKLSASSKYAPGSISELYWNYWVKKADKMWSEAIKTLAKWNKQVNCARCKIRPWNTGCHIIRRGHYATRWLLKNGYAGCSQCNFGEQMNRDTYEDYHKEMVGPAYFEALKWIAKHGRSKFDRSEVRQIYEALKRVVEGGTDEGYQEEFNRIVENKL